MSIIQHHIPYRTFDSVLVSYAAVRFWNAKQMAWMAIGNYTSILSQLIYICQLSVLAHVLEEVEGDRLVDIGARIVALRDEWLLNDTQGPVRELLDNRLLGFAIAKSEVPPAQLRWHPDGETLVWADVIFHLTDLQKIIFESVTEARQILQEELCLSSRACPVSEIPALDLA
ncbi:hypothetical protein BDW75DRAFT_246116, partial [Aspergillus navahoensis]